MQIQVVKSKIHRATISSSELNYIGSITIDEKLLEAANILEGEKVHVVNVDSGTRFETYTIRGEAGKGEVVVNGAAARLVQKGDKVIIISYGLVDFEEAKAQGVKPSIVFPDEQNKI